MITTTPPVIYSFIFIPLPSHLFDAPLHIFHMNPYVHLVFHLIATWAGLPRLYSCRNLGLFTARIAIRLMSLTFE